MVQLLGPLPAMWDSDAISASCLLPGLALAAAVTWGTCRWKRFHRVCLLFYSAFQINKSRGGGQGKKEREKRRPNQTRPRGPCIPSFILLKGPWRRREPTQEPLKNSLCHFRVILLGKQWIMSTRHLTVSFKPITWLKIKVSVNDKWVSKNFQVLDGKKIMKASKYQAQECRVCITFRV